MLDHWKNFWNERYSEEDYAYGQHPNEFLSQTLSSYTPAKILFPAEGEGRNAVYAAQLGWEVTAFDVSQSGQQKAFRLAQERHVNIQYQVGELSELYFASQSFDAIALIFAHFPADQKSELHQQLFRLLKPGGVVILEAFSKAHLDIQAKNPQVGGPKSIGMLHSVEEIRNDFEGCTFLQLAEDKVILNEGKYHNGESSVIRVIGIKN
jgi:ubiquinone/menaquinone biosynthesis C-methylase UbiE